MIHRIKIFLHKWHHGKPNFGSIDKPWKIILTHLIINKIKSRESLCLHTKNYIIFFSFSWQLSQHVIRFFPHITKKKGNRCIVAQIKKKEKKWEKQSCVTCYASHITCHMSYVTSDLSLTPTAKDQNLITFRISYKTVCRIALGTPSMLNISRLTMLWEKISWTF